MDELKKKSKKKHKRTVVTVEEQPENSVEEKLEDEEKAETPDTTLESEDALESSDKTDSGDQDMADEPLAEDHKEDQNTDDVQAQDEPEVKTEKSSTKAVIFSFFVGLVLGGLVSGGVFYYKDSVTPIEDSLGGVIVQTPPADTLSTPTPTPEPVDLSSYGLQVLNGSGVAGVAGEVAALLEAAGFSGAEVGNADASNYEETEVGLKEGVDQEVFDAIKVALADYDVVLGDELDEDSEYDVVVIVGQPSS